MLNSADPEFRRTASTSVRDAEGTLRTPEQSGELRAVKLMWGTLWRLYQAIAQSSKILTCGILTLSDGYAVAPIT